jgi:hypothetical protein
MAANFRIVAAYFHLIFIFSWLFARRKQITYIDQLWISDYLTVETVLKRLGSGTWAWELNTNYSWLEIIGLDHWTLSSEHNLYGYLYIAHFPSHEKANTWIGLCSRIGASITFPHGSYGPDYYIFMCGYAA